MARIVTHFNRIINQHKRQERKLILTNLIHDTEKNPWWIIKYNITYRGISDVRTRLCHAARKNQISWENTVRRGRKGPHVRDVAYFWCPDQKFALRLTIFVSSSPHYLEVTGNLYAARRWLVGESRNFLRKSSFSVGFPTSRPYTLCIRT